MIGQFYLYDKYASIYYAYNTIHRYMVCKSLNLNHFVVLFNFTLCIQSELSSITRINSRLDQ